MLHAKATERDQQMTLQAIITAYREQALRYGEAAERGDARKGNRAQERLLKIRREIRERGTEYVQALLRLLDDESVFVRLSAAIDALEFSPEDGQRVLEEITKGPRGMINHEARMTLKLWRSGEFTVPWWQK